VDLPLVSRDALDLVLFLPGVNTPGRPRSSYVDGLPQTALNITLDGINVQDNLNKSGDGYFTYIRRGWMPSAKSRCRLRPVAPIAVKERCR
jgi:hypothetical protein